MDLNNYVLAVPPILAAITSAVVNVIRWMTERSLHNRQREQLTRAADLMKFIESRAALQSATGDCVLTARSVARAEAELRATLSKLASTLDRPAPSAVSEREMSFVRRWFLLYAPTTWSEGILQFIFYLAVFGYALMAFSFSYNETLDEFTWKTLKAELNASPFAWAWLLHVLMLILLLRYCAVLTHEWRANASDSPSQCKQRFLLFRPINGYELLSRLMLFLLFIGIGEFALVRLLHIQLPQLDLIPPSPRWLQIEGWVVYFLAFVVAYGWSRAEYSARLKPSPRFPKNLRFLYTPRETVEWVALIAFYVFSFDVILSLSRLDETKIALHIVLNAMNVPPEAEGDALLCAAIGWMSQFLLGSLFPVYGSYRWGLALHNKRQYPGSTDASPSSECDSYSGATSEVTTIRESSLPH
jgi:hypothetical protein